MWASVFYDTKKVRRKVEEQKRKKKEKIDLNFLDSSTHEKRYFVCEYQSSFLSEIKEELRQIHLVAVITIRSESKYTQTIVLGSYFSYN